jgi:hypothetical protein
VIAHVMGLPVEESVLELMPAGAAMVTLVAVASRNALGRVRRRLCRLYTDANQSDDHN